MERRVFDLIARRFIAVFYPDCKVSTTTVMGEVDGIEFKVTGKQILEPGWRVVFAKDVKELNEEKEGEDENVLPAFVKGESGPHIPDLNENGLSRLNPIRKLPCFVRWKQPASWWITMNFGMH